MNSAAQDERIIACYLNLGIAVRTGQTDGAVQLARLIARHPHDQHAVRIRGPDFAADEGLADAVLGRADPGVQVEPAAVGGRFLMLREFQPQIAARLVGELPQRDAHEFLRRQLFGFTLFSFHQQPADFRQRFHGAVVVVGMGPARPYGVLVELHPLHLDTAEDHRAHVAVAHRQGLFPFLGRLPIPQHPLALRRRSVTGQRYFGWEFHGRLAGLNAGQNETRQDHHRRPVRTSTDSHRVTSHEGRNLGVNVAQSQWSGILTILAHGLANVGHP